MITLLNFYEEFYGSTFYRVFRRPHEFNDGRKFRIQFPIYNPQSICYHVERNTGRFPCMISTYGYHSKGNTDRLSVDPKKPDNFDSSIIIDRLFLDFDVSNPEYKRLIDDLAELKAYELTYKKTRQLKIQKQLLKLIINDKSAQKAINEAKKFAKIFQKDFGKYPTLFFSGSKGAHAYCFFKPVELSNLNSTIHYFAKKIKEVYTLETLDLSVNKDAKTRLSRIPYSKHQLTGLSVVPFELDDSYEKIIEKSVDPLVQRFDLNKELTALDYHLGVIDGILQNNKELTKNNYGYNSIKQGNDYVDFYNMDHRVFFKKILGVPVREYKNYVVYHCPFTDHPDHHPSFIVHQHGYKCYGCKRRGNYWQYLKEFKGWSDEQVRVYICKILLKQFNRK